MLRKSKNSEPSLFGTTPPGGKVFEELFKSQNVIGCVSQHCPFAGTKRVLFSVVFEVFRKHRVSGVFEPKHLTH